MAHLSHVPILRTIRIALTMAAFVGMNVQAFGAGPVFKASNEGAYAFAGGTDGCLFLYMEVGRAGTKTTQQTVLYYDLFDSCTWQLIAYGYGNIPNEALRIDKNTASLSLNVAATPSLFTQGATGEIALVWAQDGPFATRFTGHSTTSYADRTIKWHGSSSYKSATASGRFLVASFAGVSGQIGESKARELQVEHAGQ